MGEPFTYAELFAGAGGLSLGLDNAGWQCAAHVEIEPHARAVLRQHAPAVPLHCDVTLVPGTTFAGVTLISGGSPCQDMSVAGKRAGLAGARSSLFYEQVRIWINSGASYLLWENVGGALSSNKGRDFAAVLSALVGAPITVPVDGWQRGGVAAGPTAVAAWRVLDLQHFGPPQRRTRVFVLAARAGGVDPAEVLALSEGVCGHPAPRDVARQDVARCAASGVGSGSLAFAVRGRGEGSQAEVSAVSPALRTPQGGSSHAHVLAFHPTQDPVSGAVSPALGGTTDGMGVLCATGPVTHALTHGGADASEDGTGRGTPIVTDVVGTLDFGGHGGSYNGQDVYQGRIRAEAGRPRRLTPRECERLMSWPDDHTRYGIDNKGRRYALSNTARYRLCGNGVGSVCTEWIGRRLRHAIEQQAVAA